MNNYELQDREDAARNKVEQANAELLSVLKRRAYNMIKQQTPTAVDFDIVYGTDDAAIFAQHVNVYDGENLLAWPDEESYDRLREVLDEVINLMRYDDPVAPALRPHEGPTSLEVLLDSVAQRP